MKSMSGMHEITAEKNEKNAWRRWKKYKNL